MRMKQVGLDKENDQEGLEDTMTKWDLVCKHNKKQNYTIPISRAK